MKLQAVLFPRKKYNTDKARKYMDKHKNKTY